MSKKNSTVVSKVKKLMQEDEDVGKISQGAPAAIAHAMEVLLERIIKGASNIALERSDKVLGSAHLKAHIHKEASLDFLREIVAQAPELPEKKEKKEPGAKRERKPRAKVEKDEDDEELGSEKKRGRGRGRGRGRSKKEGGDSQEGGGRGRGRGRKMKAMENEKDEEEPRAKRVKTEEEDNFEDKDQPLENELAQESSKFEPKDSGLEKEEENNDVQEDYDNTEMTDVQAQAISALLNSAKEQKDDQEDDDYD